MGLGRQIVLVLTAATVVLVLAVLAVYRGDRGEAKRSQEPVIELTPERAQGGDREPRGSESLKPARCPAGVPECAETEGEILYVEAVDPDGDGDAHFVVLDAQSISLPGLTAIDVRKGLRPDPLPGPGDLVSAAGPVQTGSYGQSQIHALEFNVARWPTSGR